MATYKYRITDKFGRDKKGTLEAGSPEAATAKLSCILSKRLQA